jgi:L-ascorbate metabolism protein UlaG (beta-lactamase superfamily)
MRTFLWILLISQCVLLSLYAQESFQKDTLETSAGSLEITFIGHASLMFRFDGKIIHIDPFSRMVDYAMFPEADLLLLTHHHRDHLDPEALGHILTKNTRIILSEKCTEQVEGGLVMKNGDIRIMDGIQIEAIPAYNLVHKRKNGQFYHPKGEGNGYVLTFGNKRIYVAGDTENTPEMKALKHIDIAFLPMNLPYTMSPEMVADAVKTFKPKVLYPYHYGNTDTNRIIELLQDFKMTEVRIR